MNNSSSPQVFSLAGGNITVRGDAAGSTAWIQSLGAPQNISGAGTITIGNASSLGASRIDTINDQSISAANIYLVGGSANGGFVNLGAGGNQTISATGEIGITGGTAPSGSSTGIGNSGSGLQHITANHMFITAGASGNANGISVNEAPGGSILFDVGSGGLQVSGGAGANSGVTIGTFNDNTNLTVNVTGGGGITLQGGAGTLSGVGIGLVGSSSSGKTATVSLSTTGNLAILGGAGGGVTVGGGGNHTNLTANVAINAGTLQLTAGAGGGAVIGTTTNNASSVNHGTLNVVVAGNTTLTGSATNANTAAGIGHFGSGSGSDVTVNFSGSGSLNLIGGAQGSAVIGVNGNQANATTNLNITAGSISVTPGDPSFGIARFGHASTASGPGNIVLHGDVGQHFAQRQPRCGSRRRDPHDQQCDPARRCARRNHNGNANRRDHRQCIDDDLWRRHKPRRHRQCGQLVQCDDDDRKRPPREQRSAHAWIVWHQRERRPDREQHRGLGGRA